MIDTMQLTCGVYGCGRTSYRQGWCSAHYQRWTAHGDVQVHIPIRGQTFEGRFWAKVEKAGLDECWLWTGATISNGYGTVKRNGVNVLAHRVAYELIVGPIPDGMQLDHVYGRGCRHRNCANPRHLEPVTHAENIARGALARRTHCPAGHLYDEVNTYVWDTPQATARSRACRACRRKRDRETKRAKRRRIA